MHWLWLMWRLRQLAHVILPFHLWALAMELSSTGLAQVPLLVQNHSFYKPRFFLFVFVFPDGFLMPVVMWVSVTHRMDS